MARYLIALLGVSISASAAAHHSYTVFDVSKRAVARGTVAEFEWKNPHVWLWLYVRNQWGDYNLFAFEGGPINIVSRYGWTRESFRPGEEVAVEYSPLRDGRTGGHFLRATHSDGTVTRDGIDDEVVGGASPLVVPLR